LILCAHGARGNPGIADSHARAIHALGLFADVRACCLNGTPTLTDALDHIADRPVVIVPTLMARGVTAQRLEEARRSESSQAPAIEIRGPVGEHPMIPALLAERARSACRTIEAAPSRTTLLLVAHGTPSDPSSARVVRSHATEIRVTEGFASVQCAFLDQTPTVAEEIAAAPPGPIVVIGFFADLGTHGDNDVKRLLRDDPRGAHYAGPIGTDPGIVELIIDTAIKPSDRAKAPRPGPAPDQSWSPCLPT
jgi:sirohydrochlorin cobaltochelatase